MRCKTITITKSVYDQFCDKIDRSPAETGGIIGSSNNGSIVDHFYFDQSAHTTGSTYSPDTEALNRVISEWNDNGIRLVGFIHSHPRGSSSPSNEDHKYGIRIMKALGMKNFFMPIVNVSDRPDGRIKIFPYSIDRRFRMHKQPIVIAGERTRTVAPVGSDKHTAEQFSRIQSLYPLDVMKRKTVVCIGCGGSRQFIEELARSGVGSFVLMDGDTVSAANIATQQVYGSEIFRNKVDVIKERILDINPSARVKAVPRFLDDSLFDHEFEKIVGDDLVKSPKDVLICGCTDNFHAQAHSAALAMKYGTPYLAAQLYRGGLAAEIYFSYPGVTNSSCPRCALHSRYEAYANGYKNDVTSGGTPIFATTRANSIKGQIFLMLMLYREDKNCVYSDMLDRVADRNFVMIRMSPLADKSLGINIFQEAVNAESGLTFFDETVWIPQTPNDGKNGSPICPLCHGNGNLLALKGKIGDTRKSF